MRLHELIDQLTRIEKTIKSQNREDPVVKILDQSNGESTYSEVLVAGYVDGEVRIL